MCIASTRFGLPVPLRQRQAVRPAIELQKPRVKHIRLAQLDCARTHRRLAGDLRRFGNRGGEYFGNAGCVADRVEQHFSVQRPGLHPSNLSDRPCYFLPGVLRVGTRAKSQSNRSGAASRDCSRGNPAPDAPVVPDASEGWSNGNFYRIHQPASEEITPHAVDGRFGERWMPDHPLGQRLAGILPRQRIDLRAIQERRG